MGKLTAIAGGLGIGAAMMYFLDPERGAGRRSMVRDQFQGTLRSKREALDVMTRDFNNRTRGMIQETRSRVRGGEVSDEVLVNRVRSEIGRFCSHSGSVQVTATGGNVVLSGPILADEAQVVVTCARKVPGVRHVNNMMDVHESAAGVPGLQGEGRVTADDRWTPSTAFAMGVGGSLLTLYGLGKRGPLGAIMSLVGMAVISKSFSDTEHRFEGRGSQGSGSTRNEPDMPARTEEFPVPASDASMM
jgi:hypothetical protein